MKGQVGMSTILSYEARCRCGNADQLIVSRREVVVVEKCKFGLLA